MGGGTSIWASPDWKRDPAEIFNTRLWYLVCAVAWAGCSYGFDQGNIGGVLTLPSFRHAFGLDELDQQAQDDREGNIAAMSKSSPVFLAISRISVLPIPLVILHPISSPSLPSTPYVLRLFLLLLNPPVGPQS
jgi:hypothetical protein